MRLWHGIVLACAGLAVLSLAGYVAWQQLSFARGFADYLDRIALERAAPAAPRLADHYTGTAVLLRVSVKPGSACPS